MARAHNIWIVTDYFPGPLTAFTVKRELVTWLKSLHPAERQCLKVWRVVDASPKYAVVELAVEELIA